MAVADNPGEIGADGLRHFPQIDRSPAPPPSTDVQKDTPGVVSAYTRGSIVPKDGVPHIASAFENTAAPEVRLSPYEAREAAKLEATPTVQRPLRRSFSQKALKPEQPRNPAPRLEPQNQRLVRPVHRMVRNDLRQMRATPAQPVAARPVRPAPVGAALAPPTQNPQAASPLREAFTAQEPAPGPPLSPQIQAPRPIPSYARITPDGSRGAQMRTPAQLAQDQADYQAVKERMNATKPRQETLKVREDFARSTPKAKRNI